MGDHDLITDDEWPVAQPVEPLPPCDGRVFHEREYEIRDLL